VVAAPFLEVVRPPKFGRKKPRKEMASAGASERPQIGDLEVFHVQCIFRHGARTPFSAWWPRTHKGKNEGSASKNVNRPAFVLFEEEQVEKEKEGGEEALPGRKWAGPPGVLTMAGARQGLALGDTLRARYGGLIQSRASNDSVATLSHVRLRVSPSPRCQATARCVAAGLVALKGGFEAVSLDVSPLPASLSPAAPLPSSETAPLVTSSSESPAAPALTVRASSHTGSGSDPLLNMNMPHHPFAAAIKAEKLRLKRSCLYARHRVRRAQLAEHINRDLQGLALDGGLVFDARTGSSGSSSAEGENSSGSGDDAGGDVDSDNEDFDDDSGDPRLSRRWGYLTVFDLMQTLTAEGVSEEQLPAVLRSEHVRHEAELLAAEAWAGLAANVSDVLVGLGIGLLMLEMDDRWREAMAGTADHAMVLYAGHDTTLLPLLCALRLFEPGHWPCYTACVAIELLRHQKETERVFVRVRYMDKPVSLTALSYHAFGSDGGVDGVVLDARIFFSHWRQMLENAFEERARVSASPDARL
jgi:Histidine phosphatase superfamily (branch 2)